MFPSLSETNSSGESRKSDLDKVHACRDAIRDPGGRRVAEYAAILYPGRTRQFSRGMEAIGVQLGQAEGLFRTVKRVVPHALQGRGET